MAEFLGEEAKILERMLSEKPAITSANPPWFLLMGSAPELPTTRPVSKKAAGGEGRHRLVGSAVESY